jgi:hypothetical protein
MIGTHQTARARTVFSSEFETLDFPLIDWFFLTYYAKLTIKMLA